MVQLHGIQMSSFFRGQQWDNHAATDTRLLPFHARANRDPGPDATVMETYLALPGSEYIYSEYDLGIIADILTTAEHSAANLARKGKGKSYGAAPLHDRILLCIAHLLPCHYRGSPFVSQPGAAASHRLW